jgi:RecB family exonuclease
MEEPGDVLSPSSANGYLGCGFKWFGRYILKLPDPPTGALTMGSAVHAAINANFEQKIETREDLPAAGVKAIYTEAWDLLVKGEYPPRYQGGKPALPTEFRDDEEPGELKKQGEALTLKYLDEACPEIEPAAVEFPVTGTINGIRVRGYIDLLDTQGRIIDLKTAARKPSEISSDYRFQVATYRQLLGGIVTGEARVDTLVKTKTPQLVQIGCTVDQSDVEATEKLYPLVQRGIRGGFFPPNRASNLCSRKYCAFWRACERQFGGKVAE